MCLLFSETIIKMYVQQINTEKLMMKDSMNKVDSSTVSLMNLVNISR